jgi:hypothetical protein
MGLIMLEDVKLLISLTRSIKKSQLRIKKTKFIMKAPKGNLMCLWMNSNTN